MDWGGLWAQRLGHRRQVGVVNVTMAPRRKYRGLNVFPTKRFNMGQSFKLDIDLIRDGWMFSLL